MARKPTRKEPPAANQGGEGGRSSLLLSSRARADARMVERAVRAGWNIPVEMREAIKDRLLAIVKKKTVDIPCGEGVFPSEAVADSNAIAAARVAATINAQDQADDHHADDVARGAGEGTKIQTIVLQGADVSRLLAPPKREVVE